MHRAKVGRAVRVHRIPSQVEYAAWSPSGQLSASGASELYLDLGNQASRILGATGHFCWSPNGNKIVAFEDGRITTWDVQSAQQIGDSLSFTDPITDMAWDPSRPRIGVAFEDGHIEILDPLDLYGYRLSTYLGDGAASLQWADGGDVLFAASGDGNLTSYDVSDMELTFLDNWWQGRIQRIIGQTEQKLLTLAENNSINVHELPHMEVSTVIEPATGEKVVGAALSPKERLIVLDEYGVLGCYSARTYKLESVLQLRCEYASQATLIGFNRAGSRFAYLSDDRHSVFVHNSDALESGPRQVNQVHYQNAKVVLVGDTGVGKSGLAAAVAGETFQPTSSTHARIIRSLPVAADRSAAPAHREVLLWDLAGQPGYRSFHKLSLRGISVGLVVFDSRSEASPFKGVGYWAHALDEASSDVECARFLVSARSDRGSLSASLGRTDEVLLDYNFTRLFETSAATGEGIDELKQEVFAAIDWQALPIIVAPKSLLSIRAFLIQQRTEGTLIATVGELFASYQAGDPNNASSLGLFETCLERLEAAGVVVSLSRYGQWLLQPELLDSYVAYLADAARREPDGLGSISEQRALSGDYPHAELQRSTDERTMLLTSVEEVVTKRLALRVNTDRGAELVFPSERRTDLTTDARTIEAAMEYRFKGTLAAVYAGLVVKFVNSALFGSADYSLYHNMVVFGAGDREQGFAVDYPRGDEDQHARLVAFFGPDVNRAEKVYFLQYLEFQLNEFLRGQRLERVRLYTHCGVTTQAGVIRARLERGMATVLCAVCGEQTEMDELEGREDRASLAARDRAADARQELAQRLSVMPDLEANGYFHSFLCYNSVDKPVVLKLENTLRAAGIIVWSDKKLRGGSPNIGKIEDAIARAPTTLVCIGPSSVGAWQEEEYYAALTQAVNSKKSGRRAKLIPVLLPGGVIAELPPFLSTRTVVDLSIGVEDRGVAELVRSILEAD